MLRQKLFARLPCREWQWPSPKTRRPEQDCAALARWMPVMCLCACMRGHGTLVDKAWCEQRMQRAPGNGATEDPLCSYVHSHGARVDGAHTREGNSSQGMVLLNFSVCGAKVTNTNMQQPRQIRTPELCKHLQHCSLFATSHEKTT
eukprot:25716-Pelagomonas_calceolata.AAC.2